VSGPTKSYTKPWCQIGDYVLLDRYGGMKFRVGSRLFRLVNDDTIDAVVEDPRLLVKLGF
jgi:co-chaperonin GroES (HSP10)